MTHLLLTVRFLDDRYHGLLDRGGPPEWPPSPFRLFQALVAGVARRRELVVGDDVPCNTDFTPIGKALGWLQTHTAKHPPIIIAPKHKVGQAITRFVPNNDGDKKVDRQERLAAKPTIPTLFLLEPGQKPEVHYVWDISNSADAPVDRIRDAARSLTTLGWGIDMAFADARCASESEIQTLKGIRWYPKQDAWRNEGMLRTPTYDDDMHECTLCDLRHCHDTAMKRIEHGKPLKTVDKPKIFGRVLYTSVERPINRPYAVFSLRTDTDDTFRYPHAKLVHIAGMMRHAAIKAMDAERGYPPPGLEDPVDWVNRFVAGHRENNRDDHKQFSYIPLPSIGNEHADAMIRRVMIVAPFEFDAHLRHLAEQLDGVTLTPERASSNDGLYDSDSTPRDETRATLQRIRPDGVSRCYLGQADTWQSVTPAILPGHNDHKPQKTIKLIQRALQQSGIDTPCEFNWQAIPFFKNTLSAHKYDRHGRHVGYHRPTHLRDLTAIHLRVRFGHRAVAGDLQSEWIPATAIGPVAIGAGRHCGLGLMAAIDP